MTVWVAPLGLSIGLVLGGLGGGGAILTVPILVYLLGQSPRAATTGSLIIVGLTSLVGLAPHARAGRVRFTEGLTFGVLGVVGSVVGARASASVPSPVLMSAFSVLMLVVAGLMMRKRRAPAEATVVTRVATPVYAGAGASAPASESPSPTITVPRTARPRRRTVALAATGVGLLTGFFGVGGGFAVVPALVLALGFTMPAAVGTSLLVIAINSATALASRVGTGVELDWPVILTFSLFGAVGSVLGGKLVHRIDPRTLSLAFTVLLVAVGAYVGVQNVPRLF